MHNEPTELSDTGRAQPSTKNQRPDTKRGRRLIDDGLALRSLATLLADSRNPSVRGDDTELIRSKIEHSPLVVCSETGKDR